MSGSMTGHAGTTGRARPTPTRIRLAAALGIAVFVSGCSMSDVELNGGIFDLMGVSSKTQTRVAEPKLAPRAPLVLPPSKDRLPDPEAPGAQVAGTQDGSWPVDPEDKRKSGAKQAADAQAAYCNDGNWKNKAVRDDVAANQGPSGSCSPSVLSGLKKGLFGGSN